MGAKQFTKKTDRLCPLPLPLLFSSISSLMAANAFFRNKTSIKDCYRAHRGKSVCYGQKDKMDIVKNKYLMLEIILTEGDGDTLVDLEGPVHALEVLVAVT